DCTEIFIKTPKDPNLKNSTWSNYKHHNTANFIIAVAPNSAIIFVSPVYGGRASDKAITLDSGFLDMCEPCDMIQADKDFNIQEECAVRSIWLHVPPGLRGEVQMTSAAIEKTKKVANLQILVEQVIRRLKSFRILSCQLPITLVPSLDKIISVCAALTNFQYKKINACISKTNLFNPVMILSYISCSVFLIQHTLWCILLTQCVICISYVVLYSSITY
ncbi:hypothetical protein LSH36_679g01026, partial [Paralvinella palmiformis]